MAYVDTPLAAQNLSDSQPLIRGNFSSADTTFGLNHYSFTNLTAQIGKHKFVSLPVLANYAAISPAPVAGDATVYSKTAGAASQIFAVTDAATDEYQMTRFIPASFALFATNTNYPQIPAKAYESGGWTFLPGGLIMQYGSVLPGQSTSQTGTTKFPISFTSAPFVVMPTAVSRAAGVGTQTRVISIKDTTVTNTQFQWTWDNGTSNYVGFNWIAIGV